jgi:sulfur carrier protein
LVVLLVRIGYATCGNKGDCAVIINGEQYTRSVALSVSDLLKERGLQAQRVAVEVNGGIIPLRKHAETMLSDDDTVEIVTFVQGG